MRQDVYRVAYDEANAELIDIRGKFEQLLARKSRLEGVIAVLGPLVQAAASAGAETVAINAGPSQENSTSYSFSQVPNPLPDQDETGGDPFQRRIRNALRSNPMPQGLQTAV